VVRIEIENSNEGPTSNDLSNMSPTGGFSPRPHQGNSATSSTDAVPIQ